MTSAAPFPVVFALYPQVTQLDFTGPAEVFARLPGARLTLASVAGGLLETESGIDMALTVVAEIVGREYAQTLQLALEYAPEPPFACGRPEIAPPEVVAAARRRLDAVAASRVAAAQRAAKTLTT